MAERESQKKCRSDLRVEKVQEGTWMQELLAMISGMQAPLAKIEDPHGAKAVERALGKVLAMRDHAITKARAGIRAQQKKVLAVG